MILHLYTTSTSINNYFNHKIQSKNPSNKKHIKKNFFFLDSFLNNSNFFCRTKARFRLMPYFCCVKYITTAWVKETR